MAKRIISKTTAIFLFFMCFLTVCSSVVTAAENNPQAVIVDSIKIPSQHGVLKGKSVQLNAEVYPADASLSSVKWSSSNPDVIECTEGGKITGKKAGDYAYITCKAKWGDASNRIKVYCVEPIGNYAKSGFKKPLTLIFKQPSVGGFRININLSFMQIVFNPFYPFLSSMSQPMMNNRYVDNTDFFLINTKCEVRGKYGSYAYVVFKYTDGYVDGFVSYSDLSNKNINSFLNISFNDMDVWGNGYAHPGKKLTTNYNGEVEWTVSDTDIISFDESTGQVVGKKPGVAKITATADGMSETCNVYSLYRWPQKTGAATAERKRDWITETNCDTNIYLAKDNKYIESKPLAKGTSFTVSGDNGTSDGWAYGNETGTDNWGYIPIKDISTKGTISQYRNMGWIWPVKTASGKSKANYISSPYGWRDTDPAMHKGIDITTGTSGVIAGYEVVSAFDGQVIYINTNASNSTGYCVGVRSDDVDPVSGKKFVAFYMHLNQSPSVSVRQNVSKGEILGFVGNTGNSRGHH